MNLKFSISSRMVLPITGRAHLLSGARPSRAQQLPSARRVDCSVCPRLADVAAPGDGARPGSNTAFSLIELLVVMTLLTLIVLALMNVFSSTQRAFRASVTQSDVLEGSRAAMELITSDLRRMAPSGDPNAVNLFSLDNNAQNILNVPTAMPYLPLQQTLPGSSAQRTNVLNYFFMLSRENTKWIGVGYAVNVTNTASLYTLYRFYAETNIAVPPVVLYQSFVNTINNGYWTNMSPILDGVFHLVVHPYDVNGNEMTNGYNAQMRLPPNAAFFPPIYGNVGFYFYGSTIPASVELQLGVLEDHARARALSLQPNLPLPPPNDQRTIYLSGQSGSLHVFRQQVALLNVDRSVYP